MTWSEFEAGFRSVDPTATKDRMHGMFKGLDTDGNDRLSWDEFVKVYPGEHQGPHSREDMEAEIKDVWDRYSEDGGMNFEAFRRGIRTAEPNLSDDQIREAFEDIDRDASKHISKDEFMRLFGMMERGKESDKGPDRGEDRPPREFDGAV